MMSALLSNRSWALVAVFGVLLLAILFALPEMPGVTPDGEAYLTAARVFAETGGTLSVADLSTRFPPGYATLLAFPLLLGASESFSYQLIAAISLTVVTFAAFSLGSRHSRAGGVILALVAFFSDALLRCSLFLLAEPTLCALTLLLVLALFPAPGCRGARWWWITLLCAAIPLVKLSGVGVVLGAMIVALRQDRDPRRVMFPAIVFGIFISAVCILVWGFFTAAASASLGATVADRVLAWYPLSLSAAQGLVTTELFGFLPFGVLFAVGVLLCVSTRVSVGESERKLASGLLVVSATTLLFLLLSRVFFDPAIPFNYRQLLPASVLSTLAVALLLLPAASQLLSRSSKLILALGCAAIVLRSFLVVLQGPPAAEQLYRSGSMLSAASLIKSIEALRPMLSRDDAPVRLYSNVPEVVRLHLLRSAASFAATPGELGPCEAALWVSEFDFRRDQPTFDQVVAVLGAPVVMTPRVALFRSQKECAPADRMVR